MSVSVFAQRLLTRLGFSENMHKALFRFGAAMILRGSRIVVSFAFNVLLARTLGAEGVGVYFLAYTIARISTIISKVGLDQTLLRYTAAHVAQDQWNRVKGAAYRGLSIAAGLSVLTTAVVFALAPLFARLFDEPALEEPLRWIALSILPWSLLTLFSQLLQGLNRIGDAIFVQTIGIMLVNIPLLLLLGTVNGAAGATASFTLSTCIILVLGWRLWRRYTPELRNVTPEFDVKTLLETSIPLFWFDFTVLAVGMSDTLEIGFFTDSKSVGVYNTAKRVSTLASALLTSINLVVAPQFAAMHAKNEVAQLGKLARDAARLVTLLSVPIVIVFFLIPGTILGIFGAEFVGGAPVLKIMIMGEFVNAVTGPVGVLLLMSGHEKLMRNNAIATSLVYLALLVILTSAFGIMGSAWALAIGVISRNIIAMLLAYRALSIVILPLPERVLKLIAPKTVKSHD